MINTKIHGYLDYLMGGGLIISPFIFEFPEGAASTVPVILGVSTLVYSLITNYELGILKVLPIKVHLAIDVLAGIFLAATPWIFGFAEQVYLPFVILGIIEIGAGLFTDKRVGYARTSEPHTSNGK